MQDESLRARSAASAAKLSAEKFLWENEARKYVAAYERVLSPEANFDREKARSASPSWERRQPRTGGPRTSLRAPMISVT
jgi:hypothetical protein